MATCVYSTILALVLLLVTWDTCYAHSCVKASPTDGYCRDGTGECNAMSGYCIPRSLHQKRELAMADYYCCCTETDDCPHFPKSSIGRRDPNYKKVVNQDIPKNHKGKYSVDPLTEEELAKAREELDNPDVSENNEETSNTTAHAKEEL